MGSLIEEIFIGFEFRVRAGYFLCFFGYMPAVSYQYIVQRRTFYVIFVDKSKRIHTHKFIPKRLPSRAYQVRRRIEWHATCYTIGYIRAPACRLWK